MVHPRFKMSARLLLVFAAGAHGVHLDGAKSMEIPPHEYPMVGGLSGMVTGAVAGRLLPGDGEKKNIYSLIGGAVGGGVGTGLGVAARSLSEDDKEEDTQEETTEGMLFANFTAKPWYLQMHNFQESTGCAKLVYEPLPDNKRGVWDYSLTVSSENGHEGSRMCLKKGELKPISMGNCPLEGLQGKQADGRIMFKDMVHQYSERRGYAIVTEVKQSGRPYKFFMTRSRQAGRNLLALMMSIAKAHGIDTYDMVKVDFAGCYGNVPPP